MKQLNLRALINLISNLTSCLSKLCLPNLMSLISSRLRLSTGSHQNNKKKSSNNKSLLKQKRKSRKRLTQLSRNQLSLSQRRSSLKPIPHKKKMTLLKTARAVKASHMSVKNPTAKSLAAVQLACLIIDSNLITRNMSRLEANISFFCFKRVRILQFM